MGHSAKYLADRERIREEREKKRKARDELREKEEGKRMDFVQREEERREGEIDLAGDLFRGWVKGIEEQTGKLGGVYGGWSVRDEVIDQAVKN